jgi:hypothetical protein
MLGELYQRVIVKYGDLRAPMKGPLGEQGFCVISNYFDENDLALFPEVSKSLIGSEESKDILLKFPFLSKPLFDPKVISIVRDYLGPKAVLDYASGRRFLSSGSKSDEWHHDSVGHRLKIFMCITDQDDTTHTEIVPSSHRIKYSNYRNSKIDIEDVKSRGNIIKVIGKKNDLIIFDTNLLHKGVYSQVPREIVQFEFTDIRKSMMRGHVGMRMCSFHKSVTNSPLVAAKYLKNSGDSVHFA